MVLNRAKYGIRHDIFNYRIDKLCYRRKNLFHEALIREMKAVSACESTKSKQLRLSFLESKLPRINFFPITQLFYALILNLTWVFCSFFSI